MRAARIAVIGAGVGGLVAASRLAAHGCEVAVFESAAGPGGKMRGEDVDGVAIDAGPTVFTMRWAFEQAFEDAGASFTDYVRLTPLSILARHAWGPDERLDLFADVERSADAIGAFAGLREAAGFREFCARARAVYAALEEPFIKASRPNPASLAMRAGPTGIAAMMQASPFTSLWQALGRHFRDPRLRQLFGRYATYCGASPFAAPATLMLVAHVEMDGVWSVQGGMRALAAALEKLACDKGASLNYGRSVERVVTAGAGACGVELADGERWLADAVIMNGDVAALSQGLLGAAVAHAAPATPRAARSLSAVTWAIKARTGGFPLARHNVFFSGDARAEFDEIFARRRLPRAPTVYVCAQDRGEGAAAAPGGERLLCLVNAPADGDGPARDSAELGSCEAAAFGLLARCGLEIEDWRATSRRATPRDFAKLYPATGGALYGRASHGWMASFARPGSRTKMPGLYLAGGSAHPGPGVPMAALSGRQAAISVMADLASTRRSAQAATPGGTSTRSARTGSMA